MWETLSRWLIGRPLATARATQERLSKPVALAVLSSDALSSVAYATEEILLVLAAAAVATQGGSFHYLVPISLAIVVLLWVVVLSYRQTIYAYPSGGGAYIVARENLGTTAALTAGAALLVDYTLTVAVSVAAGVAAVTSAVQGTSLSFLAAHPVALCLGAIGFVTVVNLRGMRESGAIFAVPVYVFLISFSSMIAWGLARYALWGPAAVSGAGTPRYAEGYGPQNLSLLLLLAAFSGGCTAMTGVEAISNGVPAFRKPESRNAAITLLWMAGLLTILFLGTSTLAYLYDVRPREEETAISQFARTIFTGPVGWVYYLIQAATAAILILAANTSYADFPRLSSLMARDGFLPRQFADRGDRLVYSNGVIVLALLAGLLVWAFEGDVSRLIPLYAIGVFLSFTLSQVGMVRHWWRLGRSAPASEASDTALTQTRVSRWRGSLAVNALGAAVTAVVLIVFVMTKFVHGAWVVVVVLPTLVLLFAALGRHYRRFNAQLSLVGAPLSEAPPANMVLIPVPFVHKGVVQTLAYSRCLRCDVRAVYVETEPEQTEQVLEDWASLGTAVPLDVAPSPYRVYVGVLLDYIERTRAERPGGVVTVLVPEFVPSSWWEEVLHNGPVFRLKAALRYRPGVVVTSVPFILH